MEKMRCLHCLLSALYARHVICVDLSLEHQWDVHVFNTLSTLPSEQRLA